MQCLLGQFLHCMIGVVLARMITLLLEQSKVLPACSSTHIPRHVPANSCAEWKVGIAGVGCRHVNKKALDQYVNFTEQRDELVRRHDETVRGKDKIRELIRTLDVRKDEAIERTFKVCAPDSPPDTF